MHPQVFDEDKSLETLSENASLTEFTFFVFILTEEKISMEIKAKNADGVQRPMDRRI